MKVIINSMTKKERDDVDMIDASRRKRIASGSGKTVQDINEFIERFGQMRQMMVGMMSMMKGEVSQTSLEWVQLKDSANLLRIPRSWVVNLRRAKGAKALWEEVFLRG